MLEGVQKMLDRPRFQSAYYRATNESLDGIVQGLDLQPQDQVLAICGSGDQAFAILEHAASVLAIDKQPPQVELARYRQECLLRGDTDGFLLSTSRFVEIKTLADKRDAYFRSPGRLEAIRARLLNLTIVEKNLKEAIHLRPFTKYYLSNVLGDYISSMQVILELMQRMTDHLPVGGLIYLKDNTENFNPTYTWKLPANLREDKELTRKAASHEELWSPVVLRKVREV